MYTWSTAYAMIETVDKKKPKYRLDLRRNIRHRAWVLAKESYKRYCEMIQGGLEKGELQPDKLDSWTPPA